MLEISPKLFDRVPRGLFGPLGDPYAELYWDLLASLYQHEFEREPFTVLRPVALDIAEQTIRGSRIWRERPHDLQILASPEEIGAVPTNDRQASNGNQANGSRTLMTDEADVVRAARRILARIERSGWIHFHYRGGLGEIMSFHPYAARIVEKLLSVARDEQPIFQGLVHSIAAVLEPKAFALKPGLSLSEAKRHTLDLLRELKILERNIHRLTQSVLDEATTAAAVLEEGLDRYEHAIMANYHRLKTVDNVHRQRSAILERLDAFERDESVLQAAAEWYASQHVCGKAEARVAIAADIAMLRARFDAIPLLVDEIDSRNARFSGVALRKIQYLLRQERQTEGQLQFVVDALARGEAPELEFDVYKCELLADGFLYTPPTERPQPEPQVLVQTSTHDFEQLRRDSVARLRKRFGRRKIEEFVVKVLAGRDSASMAEVPVQTDEDYVRLLYVASYGLDRSSAFRLRASSERVKKNDYTYPSGRIDRVATGQRNPSADAGGPVHARK
jgi:hypothetical protein